MSVLDDILAADQALAPAQTSWMSSVQFKAGLNGTPYSAKDVVGGPLGALRFANIGPKGGRITITNTQLEYDVAAVPGGMTTVFLYLYSAQPQILIADNGAWDLASKTDRDVFLGKIALGTVVDEGSTCYIETTGIAKQLQLAAGSTDLYAYAVTTGAYTPATDAETYTITLHAVKV